MNKIDCKNAKEIVKLREYVPVFEKGGDLTIDELEKMTTLELKAFVDSFESNEKNVAIENVKRLVDEIFEKFGKEGDNMIVLSAANFIEHEVCESGDPLSDIDFERDEHWNKLYFPINRFNTEYDNLYKELRFNLFTKLNIPYADEQWETCNSALNEYWYGVIGIMKDYRIVAFVIRNDGILASNDDYESFNNEVLYEL